LNFIDIHSFCHIIEPSELECAKDCYINIHF
jgi:hypothetical protein